MRVQHTRRWPLLLALLATVFVTALSFAAVRVRGDLSDLLPAGQSAASRIMMEELRSGTASSLLLIGIEGAPADRLATISGGMAERLRHDGRFRLVDNGQQSLDGAAIDTLFAYRYLLAPGPAASVFDADGLRRGFQSVLDGLQSSASPLVQQYGLPDPTGAFPAMMRTLAGGSRVRSVGGVWFAPARSATHDRALMLAQTAASGLDFDAGAADLRAVTAAFEGGAGDGTWRAPAGLGSGGVRA